MANLAGKIALVTAAGQGIGKAARWPSRAPARRRAAPAPPAKDIEQRPATAVANSYREQRGRQAAA